MIKVDAMTADEAFDSSTDSDHAFDDDEDGILADKVPPCFIPPVEWSPLLVSIDGHTSPVAT